MAYQITFKRNVSPVNKLDKEFEIGNTLTVSVALKQNTDVFKPTFIIQTASELWNYNYVDGSQFSGRQYFITDVRSIGYLQYEVDCRTDVLSTWSAQIKNNTAVVSRQEKLYNLYLDDPYFHVYNYERIQTLKFPDNDFMKSLQYVLVTNGYSQANEREEEVSSQIEKEVEENGD